MNLLDILQNDSRLDYYETPNELIREEINIHIIKGISSS
jgi:hypothetical protein